MGAEECRILNGCPDDAIAEAVTEFGRLREQTVTDKGVENLRFVCPAFCPAATPCPPACNERCLAWQLTQRTLEHDPTLACQRRVPRVGIAAKANPDQSA